MSRSSRRRGRTNGNSGNTSATFSATVRAGTSVKFWKTIPMPCRRPSFGERIRISSPPRLIVPESGW